MYGGLRDLNSCARKASCLRTVNDCSNLHSYIYFLLALVLRHVWESCVEYYFLLNCYANQSVAGTGNNAPTSMDAANSLPRRRLLHLLYNRLLAGPPHNEVAAIYVVFLLINFYTSCNTYYLLQDFPLNSCWRLGNLVNGRW